MADEAITTNEVAVQPGDWVLFRTDSLYDRISVEIKQADKTTPKLVKFMGSRWPRQCSRTGVVAAFADKEAAERTRDAISGVAGEYLRRRRLADEDHTQRIKAAITAAHKQVSAILSRLNAEDAA